MDWISISPDVEIKLDTSSDAGTYWNCSMPTVGMVGLDVGDGVGLRVGEGVTASTTMVEYWVAATTMMR